MAVTTTTKLALSKPDDSEIVDVAVINSNMDKIDAASGVTVCTSGTRPSTPWQGQMIFETDTVRIATYDSGWKYDGTTTVCTSSTRPSSPYNGQTIYETDTKKVYVYRLSDTTWNEIGRASSGLVPVRPTTPITVGSGTAVLSSTNNEITLTGVSSVTFSGVFTDSFLNYRMFISGIAAGGLNSAFWTISGTAQTASSYSTGTAYLPAATTGWTYPAGASGVNSGFTVAPFNAVGGNQIFDFMGVRDSSQYKTSLSTGQLGIANGTFTWGTYAVTTVVDGIKINFNTNFTGKVNFYGYSR